MKPRSDIQTWESLCKRLVLDGDCLRFQGCKDKDGYGVTAIRKKKMPAHRAAYILYYGLSTVEGYVLHKCTNRDCCNPNHLYVGDQKQNVQDQIDSGTFVFGEKNGKALLTEEQVKFARQSKQTCRELADLCKVSYYTMWDVLKYRSWKHLK